MRVRTGKCTPPHPFPHAAGRAMPRDRWYCRPAVRTLGGLRGLVGVAPGTGKTGDPPLLQPGPGGSSCGTGASGRPAFFWEVAVSFLTREQMVDKANAVASCLKGSADQDALEHLLDLVRALWAREATRRVRLEEALQTAARDLT